MKTPTLIFAVSAALLPAAGAAASPVKDRLVTSPVAAPVMLPVPAAAGQSPVLTVALQTEAARPAQNKAVFPSASLPAAGTTLATSVTIVNTASHPVPTVAQGVTNVSGSVTVANGAASPVPVALVNEGARQPFQIQLSVTSSSTPSFTVPTGWRAVIEHINGYAADTAADSVFEFYINVRLNGSTSLFEFPPAPQGVNDHYDMFINQPVLAYADGGSTIWAGNLWLGGTTFSGGRITLTGYLEK